ncbi:MAG TPA: DUF1876 domain-containing protein [Polyangiales bacterium]|jgi:hypothetical protein
MTTWTVELSFLEDADYTQAIATLRLPGGRELRGLGQAKRNPEDRAVVAIGEEVAGSRALSALAHELLSYAADEIEKNVLRDDPVV